MTDQGSIAARQRNRMTDDADEKYNRRSEHYQNGRKARSEGLPKTANPLRPDPGNYDPTHPDIWEAQWDFGWDDGTPPSVS